MISENAQNAKREYMKKWRKKNPDKVKAQNERYWEKKAKNAQSDQEKEDA